MNIARYVITEIRDSDFDISYVSSLKNEEYSFRKAVRGILVNNGAIALLNVTKKNYHKLPGGGIELGESIEAAFRREILEETGCNCIVKDASKANSVVIEYRDQFKLFQISYVAFAEVEGEPADVNFTKEEKEDGFKLEWFPLSKIEEVLQQDIPTDYEGKFIKKRDLAIINFYKNSFK